MKRSVDIEQLLEEADALFGARKLKESVQVLEQVLRREPSNSTALWLKARALTDLGEPDLAVSCFDSAIRADPANAEILAGKAHTLEWLGRKEDALEAASRAVQLDPSNLDYRTQHVSMLRAAGRFEEALSACDATPAEVAAARPGWVVDKAEILRDLKRFDAAFEVLCRADSTFAAKDWARWADNLRYEGNHGEALRYYSKALELDANLFGGWYGKAMSLRAMQKPNESLEAFTHAAAADPANANCLVEKGNTYFDLRQFEDALLCYSEALNIQPRNQYALMNLGVVHDNREEFTKAVDYYKRALEVDPNFLDAIAALGWTLDSMGEKTEALQAYDRALVLQPDCFRVLNNKGFLLLKTGRAEEALSLFDLAIASPEREGDSTPWVNKARALRGLGRYDACEACLRTALVGADGPNRARVLTALGAFVAEIRLNAAEAHQYLLDASDLSSGSADAKANLAESFLRLGRYPEAREYALAAGEAYGEQQVCSAVWFLVLASYLLEGDIDGGKAAFKEFGGRLQARGPGTIKDLWDFSTLTTIASSKAVEPLTQFLLLTLIDLLAGKLPFENVTYFHGENAAAATPR